MKNNIEEAFHSNLHTLQEKIQELSTRIEDRSFVYSGLRDVEEDLELIKTRLSLALHVLKAGEHERAERYLPLAQEETRKALSELEKLRSEELSADQEGYLNNLEQSGELEELFQELLLLGGEGLLRGKPVTETKYRKLARIIIGSIAKFYGNDEYSPAWKTEELRPFWRRLARIFLPTLAPEGLKDPPYGIREGEERVYNSETLQLPLSQAVYYLENEAIPALEKQLKGNPGDPELQKAISDTEQRIDELRRMKFFPRSTPIVMEKGFYTDWIKNYSEDGELLVKIRIPVKVHSGNNLDRLKEQAQAEAVRRAAGKGISPSLDQEYSELKRIESGRRGSSRWPGSKLKRGKWFPVLMQEQPAFRLMNKPETFKELLALIDKGNPREAVKQLSDKLEKDELPKTRTDLIDRNNHYLA